MIVVLCARVALLSLVTGDKNLRPFPRFVYGNLLGILVPLPLFLLLVYSGSVPTGTLVGEGTAPLRDRLVR